MVTLKSNFIHMLKLRLWQELPFFLQHLQTMKLLWQRALINFEDRFPVNSYIYVTKVSDFWSSQQRDGTSFILI